MDKLTFGFNGRSKRKLALLLVALAVAALRWPGGVAAAELETVIPAHVSVVTTALELETALKDGRKTEIYLADDIALTKGITIDTNRPSLLIDGRNPYAETAEAKALVHTITEYNSLGQSDTLYVNTSVNLTAITLRNVNVKGANYYGLISVSDGVKGFTVVYDQINYSGPQISFNRYGTSHYKDTTIRLTPGYLSSVGECAETANIIMEGKVSIAMTDARAYDMFVIVYGSGGITVREGADVTITASTSTSSSLVNASRAFDITIGENASFRFTAPAQFYRGTNPTCFEIGAKARVEVRLNAISSHHLLRTNQFTVAEGAAVWLGSLSGSTSYSILDLYGSGATGVINNPQSFVLYSPSRAPLVSYSTGTLSLRTQQINYWHQGVAESLGTTPNYSWQKKEGGLTVVTTVNNSGAATVNSSNYSLLADATSIPQNQSELTSAAFSLANVRTLSLGELPLTGTFTTTAGFALTGSTAPGAMVTAYIDKGSGDTEVGSVISDAAGAYRISLDENINGRTVQVRSYSGYLISELRFTAEAPMARVTVQLKQAATAESLGESYVLEGNGELFLQPPALTGFEPLYYLADGVVGTAPLSEPLMLVAGQDYVVTIYYGSTQLVVQVPVQLMFAAFYGDGGTVVSPAYEITNFSDLPVQVSVARLTTNPEELRGVVLKESALAAGELQLGLRGGGGFAGAVVPLAPDISLGSSGTLGSLHGTQKMSATGSDAAGTFAISGRYIFAENFGQLTAAQKALQPKVYFEFVFTLE